MDKETYKKYFKDYYITGCVVRNKNIIYFITVEDIEEPDTNYKIMTRIVGLFRQREPGKQWGFQEISNTKKLKGSTCFVPDERFIGVDWNGFCYVMGGGVNDFEDQLPQENFIFCTDVQGIAGGKAYAIGTNRMVMRRDGPNQWVRIDQDMQNKDIETAEGLNIGFNAIDGFTEQDLYACGYDSDVWRYDGKHWTPCKMPLKADFYAVCCAGDGYVYLAGMQGLIVKGRKDQWEVIKYPSITSDRYTAVAWFKDRLYLAKSFGFFVLDNNEVKAVEMNNGVRQYSFGSLSANEDILVSAGPSNAVMYDGKNWQTLVSDFSEL